MPPFASAPIKTQRLQLHADSKMTRGNMPSITVLCLELDAYPEDINGQICIILFADVSSLVCTFLIHVLKCSVP